MKSQRGFSFSSASLILCAVLWTAATGAQAMVPHSTLVLSHSDATAYTFTPDTPADWLITGGVLQAGIGAGHPGHNSAAFDLSPINWSLDPAKRQNWSLNPLKRNEWGGWMDLNRPAVSGWLEGRYSCAYVLACDKADFTDPAARGYAIGFKAGGTSPLVLFRFDAGINDGALQLPANTTEIVPSGYNYLDSDNGVNFHVRLQPDGSWAVRWRSGAALPPESVFDVTNYTAQVMSSVTDTTYQGYDFKYAGWVYAHSISSMANAYFDNLGAGETPYDFTAPALGTVTAPTYAKAPFTVAYSGVTDAVSGVASVEVWAKRDSQTAWALAGSGNGSAGSVAFTPTQGDGTYGFATVTVDRDGNRSAEPTSATAPLDTTVYDTVQPTAGPVVATPYSSTSLVVSYSGTTDTLSGLASVQLWYSYNNENSWTALSGMTTSTSSASFTLDPSTPSFTLSEGVYYFGFVVTDNAGNTTSTASGQGAAVSYFDTTPPTAGSVMAPQYMTGGMIPVSYGGFLDGVSGLREVRLGYRYLEATTPTWVFDPVYTTTTEMGEFLFNPVLGNGTYEFQAQAWDNAGNTVLSASTAQTIVDNVAPEAGTVSLVGSPFQRTTPILLAYNGASDALSGLKTVHLWYAYWNNALGISSGWVDSGLTATTTSGTFSFEPPVDLYLEPLNGQYNFDVVAVDNAGNVSALPSGADGTPMFLDTVLPDTGTVSSPEYANTAPFTVSYSGVTDDIGLTSVTLYSNSWSNPIGTIWYSGSGSVSYTPPSDGIYVFGLRASDFAENMAENPTSSTTIYDTMAPTTGVLSVAAVTSGTVIPVTYTYPTDNLSGVSQAELWHNLNGTGWTTSGLILGATTTSAVVNFTPPAGANGVYEFGIVAEDRAGNVTQIAPDAATSTTYDNLAPSVGTVTAPAYTSVSLISVAYSGFADAGLGLDDVRLWYREGASGTWTASPTQFSTTPAGTFTYTALADGTYYFAVVARDVLGNSTPLPTVTGAMDSTVYDTVAPTVASITPSNAGPISSSVLDFNVVFSEPVQGFVPALQLVLEASGTTVFSTATLTGSGNTYTAHVTGITGNGALRLQVLSAVVGGVTDLAGNLLASGLTSAWVGNDSTPPSVLSINRKAPLGALTSATQVTFEVGFDEPVRDVAKEDFTIDATGSQVSASLLSVSGSGTTWTAVVNTADGTGTLSLDVVAGSTQLRDIAGNALAASFSAGQVYTVDREAPYVTAITRETPADVDTSATVVTFKVAFNEPIFTTLTASNFTIEASGAQDAALITTVTSVAATSATWLVQVATAPGAGDLGIALTNVTGVVDQVGLGMTQPFVGQGEVYHVDRGNPTVTSIVRYNPADSRTKEAEVQFLMTFNEPVAGVSTNALSLNATDGQVSATLVEVLDGGGDSSTYTIRVATAAPAGRLGVNVDRNLSEIQDAFGNPVVTTFTQGQKYDVNRNAPVVERAIPTSGTTVASLTQVIAVFDSQVTGVAAGDLTVNGSVATTVTALGYHMYRFEGFTEPVDGPVSVVLVAGVIEDLYGNAFTGEAWSYVKDSAALTVLLGSSDVVNGGSSKFDTIYMTATFSAPVTGFNAAGDITVTNATVDNFYANSPTEYEFFVHPTAVGEVTVQIAAGVAQSVTSATLTNVASTVFAFSHDNEPTTVETIERRTPVTPLTNAAVVVYRVVFSEPVRGPAKTNFTAVGTDGQTTASVASVAAVDPTALGYSNMWDVAVNTVDNSTGTLKINLVNNLSRIVDMAGNSMQIAAAFTAGESYTVDRVKPELVDVERYQPTGMDTNAPQVVNRYTFDKPVRGLVASMFSTEYMGGPQSAGTIVSVTPVGVTPATQWLVMGNTVDDAVGYFAANLEYSAQIIDQAGNPLYAGGDWWDSGLSVFKTLSFYIDRVDPAVYEIVRNDASPTSASQVSFHVQFREYVRAADLGISNFSIDATGDQVGATILSVTPDVGTYALYCDVVVATAPGKGTLSIDLSNTAGIVDSFGNSMIAGFVDGQSYVLDRQGPMVLAIERFDPATAATSATQVTFKVTFDEAVSSVTLANFTIDATSNQAALTSSALQNLVNEGDGTTWTVTVDTAKGLGWLSVDLTTTTGILDLQGNELLFPFTGGEYYEISRVPFCVAINRFDPLDALTSASQVTFEALFSDDVNNVTSSDFAVDATDGQVGSTIFSVTGAGTTWTVTVNTVDMAKGLVSVDFVTTAGVTDNLGNTVSGAFTAGEAYEVNRLAPQLLSVERYNPLDAATSLSQVVFKATFSQPVVTVTDADFAISLDSTFDQIGAYVDAVTGTSTTWYVQVQTSSGIGDLGISLVQPTAVTDGAGNPVADIAPAVNEMYSVSRLPEVLAIRRQTPLDPNTNAAQVVFEVSFNERVLYVGTDNFSIDATDAEVASVLSSVVSDPSGENWSVTVDTAPGVGTLSVDLDSNLSDIEDVVGYPLTIPFTAGELYLVDREGSTVTVNQSVAQADPTSGSIVFDVVFSDSVWGFTTSSVQFVGTASVTTCTVTGADGDTTYTINVTGVSSDGTVVAEIPAGAVLDQTGNGNLLSTSTDNSVTYDSTPPLAQIALTVGQANPTNASVVVFDVTFSEPVTGFDQAADVSLNHAGTSASGVSIAQLSPTSYTVTVAGVAGNGSFTLAVNAASVRDSAGNTNTAGSPSVAVLIDNTRPVVTAVAPSTTGPTNLDAVDFTVTFSEPVTGFAQSDDVTVNNTGTVASGVSIVEVSPTTYTVTVSGIAGDGFLSLSVNPSSAQDYAGNGNTAGGPSAAVAIDNTRPEVTAMTPDTTGPTNADSVVFTVGFSEGVSGFAQPADVTVTPTGTVATTGVALAQVSPTTYTVTVNGITGDGSLTLNVNESSAFDAAGNPNNPAGPSVAALIDNTAPTVASIVPSTTGPTSADAVDFAVTFSEDMTGFDQAADVVVTHAGTASTSVMIVAVSASQYTVTVEGVIGDGSFTLSVASGAAQDQAGNANSAGGPSEAVLVDNTAPTVASIVPSTAGPTNADAVDFSVTFSEDVTGFDLAADVVVTHAGTASTSVTIAQVSATTYTVTVSGLTGDGSFTLGVASGAALDQAGNANSAGGPSEAVLIDNTAPTVASIVPSTAGPINADAVDFAVTFSEDVTGFDQAADVVVNHAGTASTSVTIAQVSATTYTVTVSGLTGDGSFTLGVTSGAALDQAGNANSAGGPSEAVLVDNTAPTVASIVPSTSGPTNADAVDFSVTFSEDVTGFDQAADVVVNHTGTASTSVTIAQVSATTYTVTVSGLTGDGSFTLGVASGAAQDQAGNANSAGGPSAAVLIDNTAPTVASIVPSTVGPTNADAVDFAVMFSEDVTGFDQAADVVVTHAGTASTSVTIVAVSASQYTVTVAGITGDGSFTLGVASGAAQDQAGNSNAASSPSAAVVVDNTVPTVVAVEPAAESVVASVTSVTVTLSEPVVGLLAGDLKLNGVAAISVSGSNPYVFTGFGTVAEGEVEAVLDSTALDSAGNALAQTDWMFTIVSPIPLTVALDSVDVTSGSFTNLASVDFVTTFSEPVEDLTTASITAVNATIQSVVALTSRTFTFVAVPQGDGLVTVQIPAGATTSTLTDGRMNAASDVFPFYRDTTAPVLSGAPVDEGAMTSDTALVFTWAPASDAGVGLATYEYQLASDPSFATVATSGTLPYQLNTMTVTGGDGLTWYFRIRATDALGNVSAFSVPSDGILLDVTSPYVRYYLPSTTGPTTVTVVDFDFFFNEPVFGFGDPGDLVVNATGSVTYTTVTIAQVTPTTYTATVAGIAGAGTLTVQVNAGVCVDVVGNPNVASLPSPTVWIGGEVPAPVMVAEPVYTSGTQNTVFWSSVAGAVSYTVEAATNAGFTTGVTSQTVTATQATLTGLTDGAEYFYRALATIGAENTAWSNTVSSTQDATAPTVDLALSLSGLTSVSQAVATATFSEAVTGFGLEDVVTTNAAVTSLTQVNASTYTFVVTAQTSGTVAVQVLAGGAVDRAGNGNAISAMKYWILDQTAPTVTIASLVSDPTSATVIPILITFSEPVPGFILNDIVTSNATVSNFVMGADLTTYTADLNVTLTEDGVVTADIAAGVATDVAGNPNTTATQFVRNYLKSLTQPTVVISTTAGDATNLSPIPVTVTFDQDVTGFESVDVDSINGVVGHFMAVSARVYTFEVTPSSQGLVTVDVAANVAVNSKGMGNVAAAQLSVIYDIQMPNVTLTSSASEPTTATIIPVTITFDEPVIGFTADDMVTSNATVADFVEGSDGTTYTANLLVTLTEDGVVMAQVPGAAATDLAGNPNTTATIMRHFVFNGAAPVVVISTTAGFATHLAPIPVTVTFDQDVTEFQMGDVAVVNGTVTNFTEVSEAVYTFDVAPAAEGTVTVNVAADVAVNVFGKGNLAAAPLSVVYDITAPTVALTTQVDDPTTQPVVSVTATFSEAVSELTPAVISVLGATVSNLVTVDAATYTFDVTAQSTGDIAVQITAGVVQDAADNGNLPSNVLTWTVDPEAPMATLSSPVSATSDTLIPAQVAFSEPVFGFSAADLVTVAGVAIENFAAVDASDTTFTFDLRVSLKANAVLTVDVPAGVCVDVAGNGNRASNQLVIAYEYNPENFALAAPTGVIASDGVYTFKTRVEWVAVEGASFYKVYRAMEITTGTAVLQEVTGWISALSIDDQTAEPGVKYLYQVRAASTEQGGRQSELSAADLGWIAAASVPATAWYKIQYANCTLDPDSTSVSLAFTGTGDKSTVKIQLLPKGKPANAADVAGKIAYRELAKLESFTVDGNLKSFYSQVDIESFEATGLTSAIKSLTTKNANISFISAAQLGTVKIDVAKHSTGTSPEFPSTSIYTTGDLAVGAMPLTAKVQLTGTILADLDMEQTLSYIKAATKKYTVKVNGVKEYRVSLGGIGPVLRVVNDVTGQQPAEPFPMGSNIRAQKITSISVSGSSIVPDLIDSMIQKITTVSGYYKVTNTGSLPAPVKVSNVVVAGNIRVTQIVSTDTMKLLQATPKVLNGVSFGGLIGVMGQEGYPLMTVLAPNFGTIYGKGGGVSGIFIAGYNKVDLPSGPHYSPNYTGAIKKIASKKTGGQLWGAAYMNPALVAKLVFVPKGGSPNFVVNPVE